MLLIPRAANQLELACTTTNHHCNNMMIMAAQPALLNLPQSPYPRMLHPHCQQPLVFRLSFSPRLMPIFSSTRKESTGMSNALNVAPQKFSRSLLTFDALKRYCETRQVWL